LSEAGLTSSLSPGGSADLNRPPGVGGQRNDVLAGGVLVSTNSLPRVLP